MATTRAHRREGRPTRAEAAQLDREVRESALRFFLEHGYEGTSMDAIARGAGTTKASLYARFPSKEAIFTYVFEWAVQRDDWPVPTPPEPDLDDLEGALLALADAALRRALDPNSIQLGRIAIAQASRFPDLARRTLDFAAWPRHQTVIALLRRHAEAGVIVADEPEVLAEHFLGLVAGVPARLASFGIVREAEEQDRHTRAAVDLFLRALRP